MNILGFCSLNRLLRFLPTPLLLDDDRDRSLSLQILLFFVCDLLSTIKALYLYLLGCVGNLHIDIKKVMLITVVILNTSIALALLYVALQLWRLRLRLVKITHWIIFVDNQAHTLLGQALEKININQENISHLGRKKHRIDSQMQNLQQVIGLIVWSKQLWGRYLWLIQLNKLNK